LRKGKEEGESARTQKEEEEERRLKGKGIE